MGIESKNNLPVFSIVREQVKSRLDLFEPYAQGGMLGNHIAAEYSSEESDPFRTISKSEEWQHVSEEDKGNLAFCLGVLWGYAAHKITSARSERSQAQ